MSRVGSQSEELIFFSLLRGGAGRQAKLVGTWELNNSNWRGLSSLILQFQLLYTFLNTKHPSSPRVDVLQPLEDLPGQRHVVGGEVRGLVIDILHHSLDWGQAAAECLQEIEKHVFINPILT